jgi:hypothetical protein
MATTTETNTIELRDCHPLSNEADDDAPNSYPSEGPLETLATALPPADGGKAAWRLLLAAFVFEALLWGQYYFYK